MPLDANAGSVFHTTDQDFDSDVLQSDVPVLVDFWAQWCGPCRAIAPHLETLAPKYAGKAKIVKVDIDSNPETPGRFGVRSIPTLLVFKNGEVVDHMIGNPGAAGPLEKLISKNL